MPAARSWSLRCAAIAQDKVVNVYNWSDYIDPQVLKDFTAETGIKVVYDVYDNNDIVETKLLAGGSGYDLVVPTDSNVARQIQAGTLMPLDKSKIPNLANMWPVITERLQTYDPGNEHAVNYMWGTSGLGINVDKVKERLPDVPLNSLGPALQARECRQARRLRHLCPRRAGRRSPERRSTISASTPTRRILPTSRRPARSSSRSGPISRSSIPRNISMRSPMATSAWRSAIPATSSRRGTAPPRPTPASRSTTSSRRKAR